MELATKEQLTLTLLKTATAAVEMKGRLMDKQVKRIVSHGVHVKIDNEVQKQMREALEPFFKKQMGSIIKRLRGMAGKEFWLEEKSVENKDKQATALLNKIYDPTEWTDELKDTILPILAVGMAKAVVGQLLVLGVDVRKKGQREKGGPGSGRYPKGSGEEDKIDKAPEGTPDIEKHRKEATDRIKEGKGNGRTDEQIIAEGYLWRKHAEQTGSGWSWAMWEKTQEMAQNNGYKYKNPITDDDVLNDVRIPYEVLSYGEITTKMDRASTDYRNDNDKRKFVKFLKSEEGLLYTKLSQRRLWEESLMANNKVKPPEALNINEFEPFPGLQSLRNAKTFKEALETPITVYRGVAEGYSEGKIKSPIVSYTTSPEIAKAFAEGYFMNRNIPGSGKVIALTVPFKKLKAFINNDGEHEVIIKQDQESLKSLDAVALDTDWMVFLHTMIHIDKIVYNKEPPIFKRFFQLQTKSSTATEWLDKHPDDWMLLDDLTAAANVPDFYIMTELPRGMKIRIASHLKKSFAQPYWDDINVTTGGYAETVLRQGLKDGWSIVDMASEMQDSLGGDRYARQRAYNIARTESGNALNGARKGVMDQLQDDLGAEVPMKATWLSVLGTTTRDSHAHLDGVPADKNGMWYLGGVQVPWPGHYRLPASERCNCQCSLVTEFGMTDAETAPLLQDYYNRIGQEQEN